MSRPTTMASCTSGDTRRRAGPDATQPPPSTRALRLHSNPIVALDSDAAGRARLSRSARLLAEAASTTDKVLRRRLLDEMVLNHLGVARAVAARYRRRGIPDEDLTQVAYLGLTRAVHEFDPSLEHDFLAYAVPVIRSQIRTHLRNHGWTVSPSRRLADLPSHVGSG